MQQKFLNATQFIYRPKKPKFPAEILALDFDLMPWNGLHPNSEAQPVILKRISPLVERAVKM